MRAEFLYWVLPTAQRHWLTFIISTSSWFALTARRDELLTLGLYRLCLPAWKTLLAFVQSASSEYWLLVLSWCREKVPTFILEPARARYLLRGAYLVGKAEEILTCLITSSFRESLYWLLISVCHRESESSPLFGNQEWLTNFWFEVLTFDLDEHNP